MALMVAAGDLGGLGRWAAVPLWGDAVGWLYGAALWGAAMGRLYGAALWGATEESRCRRATPAGLGGSEGGSHSQRCQQSQQCRLPAPSWAPIPARIPAPGARSRHASRFRPC